MLQQPLISPHQPPKPPFLIGILDLATPLLLSSKILFLRFLYRFQILFQTLILVLIVFLIKVISFHSLKPLSSPQDLLNICLPIYGPHRLSRLTNSNTISFLLIILLAIHGFILFNSNPMSKKPLFDSKLLLRTSFKQK